MVPFIIWIITFGLVISSEECTENCQWTFKDDEVKVNCSERGLQCIPKFNDTVTYLDLSHNEITDITNSSLPQTLKHLDFSWNHITQLKVMSFGILQKLTFLDLSNCKIRDVEKGVFGELVNLRYLNLSYNRELGFASLHNITFNLNKTSIFSLNFNGINCATGVGTVIRRHHFKNVESTNLTELFLANNRLELFEPGVIYNLPKSVRILSTAENKLTAGIYLLEYQSMSGLKILNMSYQLHPPVYPNSVVDQCDEKVDKSMKGSIYKQKLMTFHFNWSMPFPPKLETLYAQSSRLYIVDPKFSVIAPNLRHVYLQNNFILSLKGEIRAKGNQVETIDISNNFCSHLFRSFDGNSVRHINISHNDLSQDLERDTSGELFKTFTNLEVLDMSYNKILSLPKLLLQSQNKLKFLNASNNRLSNWYVDLKHMLNIIAIDLSDNKFATLSSSACNQLKSLFQRPNVSLDLSGNGIACTCENQKFLIWMLKYKSHFINIENYTCSSTNSLFKFKSLESSLNFLQKQCTSYMGWYIGCSTTLAIFITFVISSLLVRNKWKIRYLIYKSKKKLGLVTPVHKCLPISLQYEYDVFLSYSGQELMFVLKEVIPRLEVNKNLKLLIRDRDYLPGIPKVESIMNGLQESRQTICLVSKKYLASKWRDYELNMAKVEGIEDRGSLNYVVLLLLPEVYNDEIPHKIIDLIKKDRFIEYPMESCAYDDFWDRLVEMLDQ